MLEIGLTQVFSGIEQAFKDKNIARAEYLLWTALDQYSDMPQLWFFAANVCYEQNRNALAVQCFKRALELEENPIFWANMGAAYRKLNRTEESRRCLERSLEMNPNDGSTLTNMCATFVNEGIPEEGIAYGEAAIATRHGERAQWNLALLYLEAGRFKEGFASYHAGLNHERQLRMFTKPAEREKEPKVLEPTDERAGKALVVYGEQGIGDELMFGTVLHDALDEFGRIIFECHPRLESLHRQSHREAIEAGKLIIFPTRKDAVIAWPKEREWNLDYKAPLGDLCNLYRPTHAAFTEAYERHVNTRNRPWYQYPRQEREEYRRRLLTLAQGRKIVGFAMRGGVIQTNRFYRTVQPQVLDTFFKRDDIMLVALDYEDITRQVEWFASTYGEGKYFWFPSITHAWEYHHTAALIGACDATVTVCQSVAHMSAAMGLDTFVLTPSRPAWRYGLTGEDWYWYQNPNVRLLRSREAVRGEVDWKPAIERLMQCMDEVTS